MNNQILEFYIFQDIWQFYLQHMNDNNDNQKYFDNLVKQGQEVIGKYEKTVKADFANQLMIAVLSEIERIVR